MTSQRHTASELVLYVKDGIAEGMAMAHTNAEGIGAAPGSFGVLGGTRGSRGSVRHLSPKDILSAGQEKEKEEEAEQNCSPLMTLVIEQWISMILGIICVVSGIVGIAMNPNQIDVATGLPSLKSIYVPLLRTTATVCLALSRAGPAGLAWPQSHRRNHMKGDVDDIPMVYLLYVLLAIAAVVIAAAVLVMYLL
jgi:hypothetical protein